MDKGYTVAGLRGNYDILSKWASEYSRVHAVSLETLYFSTAIKFMSVD
jgi:hypothetical protein